MPDESYAELQASLVSEPNLGAIIKGSGGLRKVSWNLPSQGKRGGVRVIYYWLSQDERIFMIYAYTKGKQENLTDKQLKELRKVVEEELHYE